jgi:tetratricopeptide (TPR) repeat protein
MVRALHKLGTLVLIAAFGAVLSTAANIALAGGQMMPGGGQMPGGGGPMGGPGQMPGRSGPSQPDEDSSSKAVEEKPEAAAKKAFTAGVKTMNKAKEFEEAAAKAPNEDKKARALEKLGDAYNKALDQFTEALSNKGDMYDAWNYVGYIHLRLGAYAESVDDYNHVLALKPDMLDAIEHRGEAYLGVDRLDDSKSAYMDLFFHARPLADQLMVSMQQWRDRHRADASGMRASDIDAFDKWLQERDGIAKQTAAIPR